MMRRIGDRRSKPRFEIVGDLWGGVETTTTLTVRNLGRGGALLDSPRPLAPDSVHWVTAVADGAPVPVQFRVRHSRAMLEHGRSRYRIGVEFIALTPEIEEFILLQVAAGDGPVSMES